MKKYFDFGSISVITITFLLFAVALFTQGITHDLLLEAGVLLVSIKLIMMAYRTAVFYENILRELKSIKESLTKNN
jgi:predicted neutral ceramidase superfamily lipid hydrolase